MNKKAKFYKADIRNMNIIDIFEAEKPDVVFHNAAQICVANSVKAPLEDTSINIMDSLNVLEAARKTGVKEIIYHVSAAIFGKPQYLPIDEKHLLNMISGYGVSKYILQKKQEARNMLNS